MDNIIYAIKMTELMYGGLKILDIKIGKTANVKSTLSQYKRSSRQAEILDLWKSNLSKSLSECENGTHKIAEKYAYKREGEKFIFLQESYKDFSESINLLLKNVPKKKIFQRKEVKKQKQKKDNYTGSKPRLIKFQGKEYKVNTWREALHVIAKQIYRNKEDFSLALKIRGKKRNYFSKDSKSLIDSQKIEGTPYFFEAKISANLVVKIINKLLSTFGYKESDLQIIKEIVN